MKKKQIFINSVLILLLTSFFLIGTVDAACPLGPNVTKDLSGALKIFRIAAPLLVIALTIIEGIRAVASGNADAELKKVSKRFLKRVIFAVLLFFIPVLIDQLFILLDIWDVNGTCTLTKINTLTNFIK